MPEIGPSPSDIMDEWSELPSELLGEIAKKINTVGDFVVFSSVCSSWRLAAVKYNWVSAPQLPWLVLAQEEEEKDRGFVNLNNNKRYDLRVPELHGCRFWSSSHGLIVTLNLQLEMHLVNPFSPRLKKVSLPHFDTLKHQPTWITKSDPAYHKKLRFYVINKAIVFKRGQQIWVAVLYDENRYLAISRLGDQFWTHVEVTGICGKYCVQLRDIMYWNGQLFALSRCGELLVFEFEDSFLKLVSVRGWEPGLPGSLYLVQYMDDVLMVQRLFDEEGFFDEEEGTYVNYDTYDYDVYKFDFKESKWIKLCPNDLGGMALFVGGDCYSMALSSNKIAGCEPNSMYYVDDFPRSAEHRKDKVAGYDTGIVQFDQLTDYVHYLPLPLPDSVHDKDLLSPLTCPIWIMPNLFW